MTGSCLNGPAGSTPKTWVCREARKRDGMRIQTRAPIAGEANLTGSGEQPDEQLVHLHRRFSEGVARALVDSSLKVAARAPSQLGQPSRDVDLMRRHARIHHLGAMVESEPPPGRGS